MSSDPQLEGRILASLKAHAVRSAWQIAQELFGSPSGKDEVAHVERVMQEMLREGTIKVFAAGNSTAYTYS